MSRASGIMIALVEKGAAPVGVQQAMIENGAQMFQVTPM